MDCAGNRVVEHLDVSGPADICGGDGFSTKEGESLCLAAKRQCNRQSACCSIGNRIDDADGEVAGRNPPEAQREIHGIRAHRDIRCPQVRYATAIRCDVWESEHSRVLLEVESVTKATPAKAVVAVPVAAVETSTHIRGGINSRKLRPLYRDCVGKFAFDVIHFLCDGSDESGNGRCLGGVVDLTAKEGVVRRERVDLLLHVTLLEVAEFLDHSGLKVGDGVDIALAVEVDGVAEGVGLLDGAELVLVALGRDLLLHLAAALAQLLGKSLIALLDCVDDLLTGKTDLGSDLLDSALDGVDRQADAVDIAVESGREQTDIGVRAVDSVHNHLRIGVGRGLCAERSGGSAVAVVAPAEAVATPAAEETGNETTEDTTEETATEAATEEAATIAAEAVAIAPAVVECPYSGHIAPTIVLVVWHNYSFIFRHN